MTWHSKGIRGSVPTWTCDSCTSRKDKCCSLTINLLNSYDIYSKVLSVARKQESEAAIRELLGPAMEAIEHDCVESSHNAQERPVAATERTYYIDRSMGCKVYSDGEIVPLTADEKAEFIRQDNEDRARMYSPFIGQ